MNYLTVDLYKDFQCVADACPNTCCAGWKIQIDEEAYQKMIECQEQLGTPAEDWIEERDDGYYARLDERQRCPMLEENNLCRVVLKLGPEYLCTTCMGYPRILRIFGNVLEGYLKVSCPEIIRRLMEKPTVQFDLTSDDNPSDQLSPAHTQLYLFASAVRAGVVDILQHPAEISLVTRLFVSFDILNKAVAFWRKDQTDYNLFQGEIASYFQEDVLYALDTCLKDGINEADRYRFLRHIHSAMYGDDERLLRLIAKMKLYFARTDLGQYIRDMEGFKAQIAAYNNFYKNYWIYHLFEDIIGIPEYDKVLDYFIYAAAGFCLSQTMALVSFADKGVLDREEYIYIISTVGRKLEHNIAFRDSLIERLNEYNAVSAAGLLMMIIS